MSTKSDAKNAERAEWAHSALQTFARLTGQMGDLAEDPETVVADLLCNLHHWADSQGLEFFRSLGRAELHHTAETRPDGSYAHPFHCSNAACGKELTFDDIQAGTGRCASCDEKVHG